MREKDDIGIDVTVNVTIKGKSVQLNLDELSELQDKIKEIFGYVKETQFVPTYPIYREKDIWPHPADEGPWVKPPGTKKPIITWGINSRSGVEE